MTIFKDKEIHLLDSNILVYAADTSSPFYNACKTLRDKGIKGEINLCVCPQVLLEFFAVITSGKRVNSPKSTNEAVAEIEKYLFVDQIIKIFPQEDTLLKTINFLKEYNTKAQGVFDLQLVACMISNDVKKIYTYNTDHFSKFEEIEALIP